MDVTVQAVNKSVKSSFDVNGVFAANDAEIGDVDVAARFDALEWSAEMIVGRKNPHNAVIDTEIGVAERRGAGELRGAGIVGIPGAEFAACGDFARRERIVYSDVVRERLIAAHGHEFGGVNVENQRSIGVPTGDFDCGAIGDDFAHADLRRSRLPGVRLAGSTDGGDVHAEPFEDDTGQIAGTKEQVQIVGLNLEAGGGGDGRSFVLGGQPVKGHAFSNAAGVREVGGMKRCVGHTDWESCFDGFGDAGPRERPMPNQKYYHGQNEQDENGGNDFQEERDAIRRIAGL